ncbi:hypothetical protein [Nocardioides sp. Leaf307]|uniref:hypothetical protein n=1 Tax=Nocardioides sp. Leaf307 TaxID=1736331 RepID=UPI0012EA2021|nr:hypothetical protein [Nocardioides sp. Leaf307]
MNAFDTVNLGSVQPSELMQIARRFGADAKSVVSITFNADGSVVATCIVCADCKQEMHQQTPALKDEVWLSIWPDDDGRLCLDCTERRLGHKVTKDDLW